MYKMTVVVLIQVNFHARFTRIPLNTNDVEDDVVFLVLKVDHSDNS